MPEIRTSILDLTRTRVDDGFNSTGGSEARLFRNTWRRPWLPGNIIRPACTIVDDGQRKEGDSDTTCRDLIVKPKLVIDLAENWERQEPLQDWSDSVQKIIKHLVNWMPPGCGVERYEYIDDDPLDVLLQAGTSESIWVIRFEVKYQEFFGEIGKL
jgi:hypothetical protein